MTDNGRDLLQSSNPQGDFVGRNSGVQGMILLQHDQAILAHRFVCYPHGVEFRLEIIGRDQRLDIPMDSPQAVSEFLDDRRVRVEFADGGGAEVGGRCSRSYDRVEDIGPGPVIQRLDGVSTFDGWIEHYWIWPLPPPPEMRLTFEWPRAGIPTSETSVDTIRLQQAGAQALSLDWES